MRDKRVFDLNFPSMRFPEMYEIWILLIEIFLTGKNLEYFKCGGILMRVR